MRGKLEHLVKSGNRVVSGMCAECFDDSILEPEEILRGKLKELRCGSKEYDHVRTGGAKQFCAAFGPMQRGGRRFRTQQRKRMRFQADSDRWRS